MPEALPDTPVHDFPGAQRNFENLLKRSVPDQPAALPANPFDGQVIDYVADAANGVVWRFRYRAASASAFKWELIGGSPLEAHVAAAETQGTTAVYGALTTPGPSITVPLAGDYLVTIGAEITNNTAATANMMSYDVGGTGAVDADRIILVLFSASEQSNHERTKLKTALAAATALVAKYKTSGGTGTYLERTMLVLPRRVG